MSGYIAGNLHVYEQVRSAQSGCNSGPENYYDDVYFIFSFVCIQFLVSLGSYLCLCLFLNVSNGVRLYYDSLYVYILLCIVFVCVFRTEYLFSYIGIDCTYICMSVDACFSLNIRSSASHFLSECLYQCSGMLSLIVRV